MQHPHHKHPRDFHEEDQVKHDDQLRKAARDEFLDVLEDDNDAALELHEFNQKKAEEKKFQNEKYFENLEALAICEEYRRESIERFLNQQRELQSNSFREHAIAQHNEEPVLHIATRYSTLDNIKSDIMFVSGVGLEVMEQLFNLFKNAQDEFSAQGLKLEKHGKSDLLITFPSALMAHQFLKFLQDIQNGNTPAIGNKNHCAPYFGLTLIANLEDLLMNEPSEFAKKLNPFKMRLDLLKS